MSNEFMRGFVFGTITGALVTLMMTLSVDCAAQTYTNANLNQPLGPRRGISDAELESLRAHAFHAPVVYEGPTLISTGSTRESDRLPDLSPSTPQPWLYVNGWPIYASYATYPACDRCPFNATPGYRAFGMWSQPGYRRTRIGSKLGNARTDRVAQRR